MKRSNQPGLTVAGSLTREEADALLSGLPLLVLHFDATGHCIRANPSPDLAPMLDATTLVGLQLGDLDLPDDQTGTRPVDMLNRPVILRAGGSEHHMLVVQMRTQVKGNGDETLLVLRAETAAEAEQREHFFLPEIVRRTQNIVVVADVNRRITWVNEAFEKRTGYTLQEVIGKRPADLVQFDGTDKKTVARISAAVKSNKPVQAEVRNRSKQGDEYWLALDIQPLWGPDGALRGYMSVQSDVSALKALAEKAEKATRQAMKQADELQRVQEQLREVIAELPCGLAVFDSDLNLTVSNQKYSEFVRGPASRIVPGADYETIMREIAQAGGFLETETEQEEWVSDKLARLEQASKGWQYFNAECDKWVEAIDKHLPNGGLVALRIDITALKTVSQRLATVLKGTEVGTWTWNSDAGTIKVDDRCAAMLGHEPSDFHEIRDNELINMIHPDESEAILAEWARIEHGEIDHCELVFRFPHKDGHWVSILLRALVLRSDASGRPEMISGVNIDITEHQRRETALEQAEREKKQADQRLFDITSVTDDAVWEQDENLRFTYISENIVKHIGIPADQIIGKTREVIFGSELDIGQSPDWEALSKQIAAHKPFHNVQYPIVSKSTGEIVWFRTSGIPIIDSEGNFRGYRGVSIKVTELVEARERAEESSRTKSLFLANMSHEIRTPLNGVLGMAELLESQMNNPEKRRLASIIRESGEALLSILNDILDMSKIEAGRLELESLPFRVADVAEAVENLHALKAEEKGLDFEVLTGGGMKKYRLGDQNRVRQILNNLIGNAIKFTETGEVTVKISSRDQAELTIEVRDTGIGISPEQQERLFQDFSQADASIAKSYGGTGLGLSIVKKLVDMMGGQISVDSALGAGTRIKVTLPIAECAPPQADQGDAEHTALADRLDGVRILAADDNQTNRLLLSEVLSKFGAEVTQVVNGEQAVEAWAPGRFDVLILDIMMPGMDGIEALKQILKRAEQSSGEPVLAIAFTANAMAHQVVEYIEAGFVTHVPKPFQAIELLKAINTILPQRT